MAAAIETVAERGAQLTARLLAFARQQRLQPHAVALPQLLDTVGVLLGRAVGEAVAVEIGAAPEIWSSLIDAAQFEAAILNLAVNARDAMMGGGRLTIRAENAVIDAAQAFRLDVPPGDYVVVSVADTGTGMTEETQRRCFEPFFTTKDVGKGTGLGLSQVYGFARQSGGAVTLVSALGRGTTISLYLPRALGGVEERPGPTAEVAPSGGGETVLVVEDQPEVREVVEMSLAQLGYRVLTAEDGPTARRILESDEPIDLLLSDAVMPNGLDGLELAERACALRPDLKVVIVSGYSPRQPNERQASFHFLAKPFRPADLARLLAVALAEPPLAARAG
jgi:CheY-like chemotaxis protein